jgi:hypothetical protein
MNNTKLKTNCVSLHFLGREEAGVWYDILNQGGEEVIYKQQYVYTKTPEQKQQQQQQQHKKLTNKLKTVGGQNEVSSRSGRWTSLHENRHIHFASS